MLLLWHTPRIFISCISQNYNSPESAPAPLAGARLSSSSKKTTHGRARLALANTSRTCMQCITISKVSCDTQANRGQGDVGQYCRQFITCRSLSPMYMLMSSGPFTLRKLSWHSVATALASSVFPVPALSVPWLWHSLLYKACQVSATPRGSKAASRGRNLLLSDGCSRAPDSPGGPYRRTPERRRRPWLNSCGWRSGRSTVSRMDAFTSSRPPTSSHCTLGTCRHHDQSLRGQWQPAAAMQCLKDYPLQGSAVRCAEDITCKFSHTAGGQDVMRMRRPNVMEGGRSLTCGAPMATAVRSRMLSRPAW